MIRVVITVILVLAVCVLVVLNLSYTTPVNLFWITFENVPVVAVGMLSFVLGVLYSFFLYASRYVAGLRKNALVHRRQDLERREKDATADTGPAQGAPDAAADETPATKGRRSRR